jgi:hypothetical protein
MRSGAGTIPGYAAHRSGKLFVNDILVSVDEVDVTQLDLEEIKKLTGAWASWRARSVDACLPF